MQAKRLRTLPTALAKEHAYRGRAGRAARAAD